ncbi:MAG: thioredoxin family protein [Acidobacteria bacterium]|nr:thioredoxin family protein [Acidobacteriota bacterium]
MRLNARNLIIIGWLFAVGVMLPIFGQGGLIPATWSARVEPEQVKPGAAGKMLLTIKLEPGWHLYSLTQPPPPRALRIALEETPYFSAAGAVQQPKPKVAFDPNFGIDTESFEGTATFTVPFKVSADAPPGPQKIVAKVTFQLCDAEKCLPPRTRQFEADVIITAATTAASATATPAPASAAPLASPSPIAAAVVEPGTTATPVASVGEDDDEKETPAADMDAAATTGAPTAGDLRSRGLLAYIWLAMGFGLFALVTPCVFPMIPITVSFFTKSEHKTHGGAVRQALVYCFGIIFTFTGLGLLVTLIAGPAGINRIAASPWMNIFLTTLFVVFALNLFGLFEIRIPSSLLSKLDARAQSGGSLAATLLMGLTFTLTSFTCTAAFVGTVLVAATQGEWFWSAIGMFAFATAFSLPFFLLAIFPRWLKSLPKSGGWLNSVKVVMGFLELAAAFKFLSNVDLVWGWQLVTREMVLAAWIALSIVTFIYLLGKFQLPYDSPVERLGVVRMLLATMFLGLAFYLLTGLFGANMGELEAFLPPRTNSSAANILNAGGAPQTQHGAWIEDYDEGIALARAKNKPVFLNFTGVTCTNCRWMESNMFTDARVKSELEKFVLVELFTDRETEADARNSEMQESRFKTVALPLYVILDPEGKELAQFPGSTRDRNEFLRFLQGGADRFAQLAAR